jgi:hypothetical protein
VLGGRGTETQTGTVAAWPRFARREGIRLCPRCDYYPFVSKRNSLSTEPAKVSEWLIYPRRWPKAAFLGTIEAPNRERALAPAFEEFEVAPAQRRRIIAQRASGHA